MQHTYGVNYLEDDGLSAFDATSYTKAFNAPIPSSTPFIGDRIALKCHRKESDNINSANENTFIVPPVAPVKELSVIEESSKEMMVGSIGTTPGASSAESERGANPSGRSYSHSVHGSASQTSSCIPIPVIREPSKENVRTSKEAQRIQKLKELTEEEKLCNLMGEVILSDDPFDHDSNLNHLKSITLPAKEREGFFSVSCKAPVLKSNSDISLRQDQGDGHVLKSLKVIGQGAYARVYKAFSSRCIVFKLLSFYDAMFFQRSSFMEVKEAYVFLDGSLLIYDYMEYGTLLNVINLYKMRGTKLPEVLALYFSINLLKILSCLHTCNIIHGDIKPDNFLLRKIPSEKPNGIQPSLQLIDLGRCIDMSLYPEGACFSTVFQKSHFQCVEMRTKRPWSYQLDLFGAASVVHCLVFGEFMEIHCKNNIWNINKKLPRNMNQQLWHGLFDTFLNISSCNKLPNIGEMVKEMETYFFSELAHEMGPAVANLRRMLNEDCAKRK
ncbi:hypothetical protein J437_LFUL005882 [Ladona fulva]|uniref:Protein kinase domain-containing protein n=1 Tax=Ladona fulva TaxID=123851 RepID=A0A8K0K7G5_LADFU|nr:hypothetical protein J437_LFUL005882 [Ladona fulva]